MKIFKTNITSPNKNEYGLILLFTGILFIIGIVSLNFGANLYSVLSYCGSAFIGCIASTCGIHITTKNKDGRTIFNITNMIIIAVLCFIYVILLHSVFLINFNHLDFSHIYPSVLL